MEDPVQVLYEYEDIMDREIAGLVAAHDVHAQREAVFLDREPFCLAFTDQPASARGQALEFADL